MSLRIRHLNGDTSFLLVFSPVGAPHNPQGTFPGSFTILIDPWLAPSPSKVFSSRFALTHRVTPACVDSLADLPDPDLVLVSQDKPDHCHEETLKQLPRDTGARILGTAAAAKKMKGWRHFERDTVQALERFDEKSPDQSICRIPVPAFSPSGTDGEVTIALLAPKHDVTGMHNAIAITYRPPSSALSTEPSPYITLPPTPPATPPSLSSTSTTTSHTQPSHSMLPSRTVSNPTSSRAHTEPTISALYTPHGLPLPLITPYITSHLLPLSGALPLTALFHSFCRASNPWYLGGNILAGLPGGLEIARTLRPRVWVSAHDEEKLNTGMSVRGLKAERWSLSDMKAALEGDVEICTAKKLKDWSAGLHPVSSAGSGDTSASSSLSSAARSDVSLPRTVDPTSKKKESVAKTLLLEMESGQEYLIPSPRIRR
ncbi:MAG: hypothetical protein M1828_003682 [Chrysothrix sp. TS-e1954]|nr:MAG: hypothetical protein M1828_003682 [Chrysothrix sp. TS-e1954]